jgi:hypothetical protein
MSEPTRGSHPIAPELAGWPASRLVAVYPEIMIVLDPLGIDLQDGRRPLGEALDRAGYDRAAVMECVVAAAETTPPAWQPLRS